MSSEDVEIAREATKAAASASAGQLDIAEMNRLIDRDHEFTSSLTGVEGQSYRGLDGYTRYREDMADAWQEWRMDLDEWIDAGGGKVLAIGRFQGLGRASGALIDRRIGAVLELRNGRLWRTHTHLDPNDAFRGAGLSEDAHTSS